MRILQVMAGAEAGGAETMMLDGVLALADAGVEQRAITRGGTTRADLLRKAGVPVEEASFNTLWRPPTATIIRRAIREFAPDVLHFWMGRAGMFAPVETRARNLGWYGGYYKVSRFAHCAWHAGVTRDIERHIRDNGVPADHASTLHTFAAVENAAPVDRATLETPAEAPVALVLSRLHWKKGIDTFLDALAELPGVYGWIAGTGPIEAELKQRATQLGLDDRVRFLGWRGDRFALLAACDLVAFPSRYEPFGNVTAEAWAANRPLVVADAAGPAATVTNGEDALLVPKDEPGALRDAMKRVIDDKALAAKLVANGRAAYERTFTKAVFVRDALALYGKIKASASAPHGGDG